MPKRFGTLKNCARIRARFFNAPKRFGVLKNHRYIGQFLNTIADFTVPKNVRMARKAPSQGSVLVLGPLHKDTHFTFINP